MAPPPLISIPGPSAALGQWSLISRVPTGLVLLRWGPSTNRLRREFSYRLLAAGALVLGLRALLLTLMDAITGPIHTSHWESEVSSTTTIGVCASGEKAYKDAFLAKTAKDHARMRKCFGRAASRKDFAGNIKRASCTRN